MTEIEKGETDRESGKMFMNSGDVKEKWCFFFPRGKGRRQERKGREGREGERPFSCVKFSSRSSMVPFGLVMAGDIARLTLFLPVK